MGMELTFKPEQRFVFAVIIAPFAILAKHSDLPVNRRRQRLSLGKFSNGMWYIGQRVVCVNDRFPSQILDWASKLPRNGQIYTVQSIISGVCLYTRRRPTLGFFLSELPTLEDRLAFRADRFAPILEKLEEACQQRLSEVTSPVPLGVSVYAEQTRGALQVAPQLAPSRSKRRTTMRERLENAAIRTAVLRAAAQERRKAGFNLFGRGYEPRITLDHSVAAILRGLDVPRVFISGYGANYFYPRRVFVTAMRSLERKFGRSPIAVAHIVYRVRDE